MKKLFTILLIASMASLVACGPSAEELAKEEQRINDSIAAAEAAIKAEQEAAAAAEAQAAAEAAIADSIAKAEEAAAAAKPAKKK